MLDISVTIKRKDGTQETFPVYADSQIAFERWAKKSISSAFDVSSKPPQEYLYYLAWLAEKNAGGTVKVFDEWVKTIAAVGAEDGPGN
jgi:predicted RNase H-like nuclease (RuvC/YqgF family)